MITVLVAEDDEGIAVATRRYLELMNFEVLHAANGESAIQTALEHKPDIILMDIQMPGLNGIEAIKRIRTIPEVSEVPVIATTGLGSPGDCSRCLDAGANLCITKPYRLRELVTHMLVLCDDSPVNH